MKESLLRMEGERSFLFGSDPGLIHGGSCDQCFWGRWGVSRVKELRDYTPENLENHLFVVENGLPRGHSPLPC